MTLRKSLVALLMILATSASLSAQDLADVIEKSERSVVRIEVKGKNGDSIGSGFVVEKGGVIVTNVHVLAGAQTATATFANGKSYEIEGTYHFDESRDICIAQLASDVDLPTIVVSRVQPRKGETVTALGAPRGLSFTATNGIVSAMRRGEDIGGGRQGTWIQIDAALSPGNSGGPLINGKGRVIAMSTLASTGSSQNLNFGIAATDIREAISTSRDFELTSLPRGVGELEMDEGGGGDDSVIDRPEISKEILADYVDECRDDYVDLKRQLVKNAREAENKFKLMRKGKTALPVRTDRDYVIVGSARNKKHEYFFRSEATKRRIVRKAEKLHDDLQKIKSSVSKTVNNESLFELLKYSGPFLDPTQQKSIGVIEEGRVLHAFNEHDAIVEFDQQPYLLWLPSTTGMSRGSMLPPTTVYVAGTETVRVPGGSTMAVTLLIGIKDSELKKAIFGDDRNMARKDGDKVSGEKMRTWKAGRFEVVAKVVRIDSDKVTLMKTNGKTVEVPRDILSSEDSKYLRKLE